ncbi:MAG TPA: MFS transporter [Actinophytocola sp.]|uniref:MFS transporter n=1 Tax=Actinophytocola sp. TaxID=1872138 RepID=UPI002DBA6A80|nr:MFS transporter [Actinophytocola sp.]HEU5473845.1 MFS transporter [Actinophytocola sp.]
MTPLPETPAPAASDRLPLGIRSGYAVGSLVTGAFGTVPGLLLLPYLTDSLAVPASAAGLLVLLPKIWDVAFNPIAGRWSDRTHTRIGARRPFLITGGSALAVFFALLFVGPDTGSVAGDAAYVTAMFLLCATAFALFQVPYNAMPAEITQGEHERTRLTTMRIAVLAVAILVSGAGAPALRDAVGGSEGYRVMGIAVGALILFGTVGVFFGTRKAPVARVLPSVSSWREVFAAVRACRPFRILTAAYVIQAAGIATLLAGVDYLARVVLGDTNLQPLLFAGFVGPCLLVMPLWQWVAARYGKRVGFVQASLVFIVAMVGVFAAKWVPVPVVLASAALAGVGYAGMQVFPLAMLPDVISAEERRTGQVRAGLFAGVWTAVETLGLALGPGLYGLVLALGGYVSSSEGEQVTQPESAEFAVVAGAGLLPALFTLAALPLLRRRRWEAR